MPEALTDCKDPEGHIFRHVVTYPIGPDGENESLMQCYKCMKVVTRGW